MRSFLFIWFLVSVAITGCVSVISVIWTGPSLVLAAWEFYGSGVVEYGSSLVKTAAESGGGAGIRILQTEIGKQGGGTQLFVFDNHQHELTGRPMPEFITRSAEQVAVARQVRFQVQGRGLVAGRTVSLQDGRTLSVVFWFPSRQIPAFPLRPWAWFGRLATILVAAGVLCSWLAWRLSTPLLRMNEAARKFASGDLTARAGAASFPRHPPEYRELAGEFDEMAGRIEGLVTSQRNLLRDVSHELRTPLTRLGLAVNNARGAEPERLGTLLDRIELESERLNALIERIVRLSRMESLEAAPVREPIEMRDFLEGIVSDANFEAEASNRQICLEVADTCRMTGDRELLREAFENVVRNAIRYTPEGGSVWVRAECVGAATYRITVRDEGPGIPPEQLKEIFHPFFRGRHADGAGFGLGLAIAERAIRVHHGTIVARNAAEGGLEQSIHLCIPQSG